MTFALTASHVFGAAVNVSAAASIAHARMPGLGVGAALFLVVAPAGFPWACASVISAAQSDVQPRSRPAKR